MQKRKETVYSKSNQINEEIHIDVRKVTQSQQEHIMNLYDSLPAPIRVSIRAARR